MGTLRSHRDDVAAVTDPPLVNWLVWHRTMAKLAEIARALYLIRGMIEHDH
jgi:hypothetical protein